jgi:TrmH family RNA methyltransferase
VIEGPDLINAAFESGVEFEALYVDEASASDEGVSEVLDRAHAERVETYALEDGVLEKVADARTPQPVLAAVHFRASGLGDVVHGGMVLVLDNIRDPGNAGTIIRSADAAGVSGVVLTGESVDPFNPKAMRASAGSIFHLPVVVANLGETLSYFTSRGSRSFATVVRGGTAYRRCDLSRDCLVVIGNEATGLDEASIALCDQRMSIEMAGGSESLNAGVAASLIAFEALHQRRDTTDG